MSHPNFDYTVKRSARRTLSIEVRRGEVIVRTPQRASRACVRELVADKAPWVERQLQRQRQQLASIPEYSYAPGCCLPYLDGELQLVHGWGSPAGASLVGERLQLLLSRRSRRPVREQARALVVDWYRSRALSVLRDKSEALAAQLGLSVTSVAVKNTRSKWGHCTADGRLQYNWQILLAPEGVVDYLVAHEVCHLRHHNHSAAFWALVDSVCPDYRQQRDWLKRYGLRLVL